jgi:O-antigen/teichoic acid export membrane protein
MDQAVALRPDAAGTSIAPEPAARITTRARRAVGSGAALLSIGTLASGVLAYVFNLLAARTLGPLDYGPVAVLWAAMFLVSVVLFRPVEQTLSREIADRRARGEDARPVTRAAARLTLALVALVTLLVAAAWGPLTDGLFGGRDLMTLALWAGIAGYAISYYVRGLLSGLEDLGDYGLLLLVDGAARVAFAVPLVAVASPDLAALAIVGAAVGGPLAVSVAVRKRHDSPRAERLSAAGTRPFALRQALGFAAPVAVIAGAEQVLVSGGALLVAITGGGGATAAAGTVFAATMLVRAPVFLFQGVAAALLPRLTGLSAVGNHRALRRQVGAVAGGMLGVSAILVAGALVAGPEIMTLLFGAGFDVGRTDLAILSAGVGTYLAAATLGQAVLARARSLAAAGAWVVAATAFVVVELSVGGAPFHRVSVAFAVATAIACALLAALVVRTPGDPAEG